MDRRTFLRRAAMVGGAAALGPRLPWAWGAGPVLPGQSLLSLPAGQAPVDHIVVLMMENRSFDHYLGWLGADEGYLEAGRSRYGAGFTCAGDQSQTYDGVSTYHLPSQAGEENPWRGCHHPDPGHGWDAGRAQRDEGFLAEDSGNDEFALGYYHSADLSLYGRLAPRFTSFDHYHCSLLGPTFPNREYLHSAQSGGTKGNDLPTSTLGFKWANIWDRLGAAGVPAGYYFIDLPTIALWGARMIPYAHHIERYFAQCAAGTLPNVTFLDPGFTTGYRTDDHPHADIRAGQNLVLDYLQAFLLSPHWENGAFIVTYDEWGGFFDHVAPVHLADSRANTDDANDFSQAGFRVPTMLMSPYALPGLCDNQIYDHTSILRFIEWRFLGAPATGPGGSGWWLTERDRNANNIGASLRATVQDAEVDLPAPVAVPVTSKACEGDTLSGIPGAPEVPLAAPDLHVFEQALHAGYFDRVGFKKLVAHL